MHKFNTLSVYNGIQTTGSLNVSGSISASADITASAFIGDGSQITGVVSSSYSSFASQSLGFSGYALFSDNLVVTGSITASGAISASNGFIGDGSQLTGIASSSYALTASYAANGGGGGGVTINNNTDNYLVTATGTADTLDGEQNLQFDGSLLTVTGDISASGDITASAFVGDGSNITGVVTASYSPTASYVNPLTQNVEITGSLDVAGAFTAQTKSFLINHQSQPGKKLIYGVLEGPEHAVYLRGRLTNDDTITFPEEWSWLVDKDSITVQLTPIWSHQQLWVEQVTETSITVNSNTDIDCYYLIHATRKDVDPLQTVE